MLADKVVLGAINACMSARKLAQMHPLLLTTCNQLLTASDDTAIQGPDHKLAVVQRVKRAAVC
jgi:hypothetical protein